MRGGVGVCAVLFLGACLSPDVELCGELVCGPGTVCAAPGSCVAEADLAACDGMADGDPCSRIGVPRGVCQGGRCVAVVCGNGVVEPGETCDDGNTVGGDGCAATCDSDERCGNAILDRDVGEECDCSDTAPAPEECGGALNSADPAAACTLDCRLRRCGDGMVEPPEECDGSVSGATCGDVGFHRGALACGPACRFDTSGCAGRCGDGVLDPEESDCDPGNPVAAVAPELGGASCLDLGFYQPAGLGCTAACTFDTTNCAEICGDGILQGDERCDGSVVVDSCRSLGFDFGRAVCGIGCVPDDSVCRRFGFDRLDPDGVTNFVDVSVGASGVIVTATETDVRRYDGDWTTLGSDPGWGLEAVWAVDGGPIYVAGTVLGRYDGSWSTTAGPIAGARYQDLWGSGPDDVYAVGSTGAIAHWDGSSWSEMPSGTGEDLHGVWGSGPGDVYAVGARSTILHRGGGAWSAMGAPPGLLLRAVAGTGPDDVVAVSGGGAYLQWDGTSWSYRDSGAPTSLASVAANGVEVWSVGGEVVRRTAGPDGTWRALAAGGGLFTAVDSAAGSTVIVGQSGAVLRHRGAGWTRGELVAQTIWSSSVWARAADELYVTIELGLLRYDGISVSRVAPGELVSVSGTASETWAVGGDNDHPLAVRSSGGSFAPIATGAADELQTVWALSPTAVFAAGYGASPQLVDVVRFDGTSWTTDNLPDFGLDATSLWADRTDSIYLAADHPFWHFDGSGWAQMTDSNGAYDVWGSSDSDIYAAGSGETIQHFDGSSWSTVTSGGTEVLYGIWVDPAGAEAMAVGSGGTILAGDAGGFAPVTPPAPVDFWDVAGVGAHRFLVDANTLYHWDGTAWDNTPLWPRADLHDVAIDGDAVWYAGDGGLVLRADRSIWPLASYPTAADLRGLWVESGAGFAVGTGGVILRLQAGSWTSMASGSSVDLSDVWSDGTVAYAVGTGGTVLRYAGSSWSSSVVGAADLRAVWGTSSTDLWVAGTGGALAHFDGTGWTELAAPSAADLNQLWGSATDRIWAVGDGGTVIRWDGSGWQSQPLVSTARLLDVGGVSDSFLFAVGEAGAVFHYDGVAWSLVRGPGPDDLRGVSVTADMVAVAGERGATFELHGVSP